MLDLEGSVHVPSPLRLPPTAERLAGLIWLGLLLKGGSLEGRGWGKGRGGKGLIRGGWEVGE